MKLTGSVDVCQRDDRWRVAGGDHRVDGSADGFDRAAGWDERSRAGVAVNLYW
jgi:hypothetical protein